MSRRSLDDGHRSGYSVGPSESRFPLFPDTFSGQGGAGRALWMEGEVIPPDERRPVPDTLAIPYRWICSLDISFDRPYPRGFDRPYFRGQVAGFGRSSGLLVGPRSVLTAAHSIYPDGKTRPSSVYVAPARNGRSNPFGRVKAVAYNLLGRAFGPNGIVRPHDYVIVTLEKDIANRRYAVLGDRPLGHWGSKQLGKGTVLRALKPNYLKGKRVYVCGYPGDKCGTKQLDEGLGCSEKDQATTQWIHNGIVEIDPQLPGLILHKADTAKGQSGSPVWIRFTRSNRHYLVGVHVASVYRKDKPDQVRANLAVPLTDKVLKAIRPFIT